MMNARDRCRWVEELVAERCFTAVTGPLTFGAELELLAFDSEFPARTAYRPRSISLARSAVVSDGRNTCPTRAFPAFALSMVAR